MKPGQRAPAGQGVQSPGEPALPGAQPAQVPVAPLGVVAPSSHTSGAQSAWEVGLARAGVVFAAHTKAGMGVQRVAPEREMKPAAQGLQEALEVAEG